jgi:iron(III) transport system substrate-binding protein
MRKSGYWLVSLIVVLTVALSACGSPQQATPAPTPALAQKPSGVTPAPAVTPASGDQQVIDAAKKEGEVDIWSNTFQDRQQILSSFNARYPFIQVKVWDAPTGPDAVNKIAEEAKVSKVSADILFSSESDIVPAMNLGLLAEYNWNRQGWLNQPTHKFYLNYATNPRTPLYNTDVISAAEAPKGWDDLKDAKWRTRSTVVSSSGAELPLLMAYLWRDGDKLGWDKAEKFLTDMVTNVRPRVMSGITGTATLVAAGEFSMFLVGSGDTSLRMITKGAPVAIVPVGQSPGLSRSVGLVKGAPHPNAAKLFLDYFTTPEGLLAKTEADFTPVTYPEAAKTARANLLLKKYGIETLMVPTSVYTAENVSRATMWWQKLLGLR